jgi:hypothetical protein
LGNALGDAAGDALNAPKSRGSNPIS